MASVLWVAAYAVAWSAAQGQSTSAVERQREYLKTLATPVTIAWRDQELSAALGRLQQLYDVSLWLDRRLDPRQHVQLQVADQPLASVIERTAAQCNAEVVSFQSFLYLGPPHAAQELPTLVALARESVGNTRAAARRMWLAPDNFAWSRLTQPRALIERWAADCDVALHGGEKIPHDLLPDRPHLNVARVDLAVILLQGFDLTCRIDARAGAFQIVDIQRPVQMTRSYSLRRIDQSRVDRVLGAVPRDTAELEDDRLVLTGRVETHDMVAAMLGGGVPETRQQRAARSSTKRPRKRRGQPAYTLKIQSQPVGAVIDQLERQLRLTIVWDAEGDVETVRGQRISCEVREATLDELLTAILEPAGLRAEREGKRVVIK